MAIFNCKSCGGDLEITEGTTVVTCEYCGRQQTVPSADNEKKVNLFNRANRLRSKCDFDKAASVYESIVAEFPAEAEAYWGLCLCKFGIEYVDDPATANKIPTCHRTSYESIFDDSNFDMALENADAVAVGVYRNEAKEIDRLQKEILEIAKNEQPFDVFICYKETAEDGQRTVDSELAHDIYDVLTEKGYKVFYSRITLKAKLGQDYEPYIFSALNSAKVMLSIGTKFEYFNAVWVKNEWSRFLSLMKTDKSKKLIPCYRDIDPYDMPKEFGSLQGQDLSSPRAFQDLVSNIEKIIPKENVQQNVIISNSQSTEPLLKRAFMCLEDGDWESADKSCEKILDIEPENAQAHLIKLCIELKLRKPSDIANLTSPIAENNSNYQKVMKFGDEKLKNEIIGYNKAIVDRLNFEEKDKIYNALVKELKTLQNKDRLLTLANEFKTIAGHRDSAEKADECIEKIYVIATEKLKSNDEIDVNFASDAFKTISGYKDSDELVNKCKERIEAIGKDKIYQSALADENRGTVACLEWAIEKYRKISGWKDADERIIVCSELLNKIKEEGRGKKGFKNKKSTITVNTVQQKEKNEKNKTTVNYITALRNEESKDNKTIVTNDMAQQKDESKNKKIIIISVVLVIVVIAVVVITIIVSTLNSNAENTSSLPNNSDSLGVINDSSYSNESSSKGVTDVENTSSFPNNSDSLGIVTDSSYSSESSSILDSQNKIDDDNENKHEIPSESITENPKEESENWRNATIATGGYQTIGVKSDGTVVAVGNNNSGQCNVSGWSNIVSVAASTHYHTVGLKSDGTVVAVGFNDQGQCNVSGWKDIVAVAVGEYHTVGLKSDGTVVAVGDNGYGQCDVSKWTDIVAIAAGYTHTIGLKSDGTVVATGHNYYGQCNVSDWKNIVAVDAGDYTSIGLKADGTVVAIGQNNDGQCNVSGWTNIISVAAGTTHTVGLKSDGTVVAVGYSDFGAKNVSGWKNIVAIAAGLGHTVGLKSDGTVVAAGWNGAGQSNVSGWNNIKLPSTLT